MSNFIVKSTLEALTLGSLSNIIAQFLAAQRENKPFTPSSFDVSTFCFFFIWTLISCPPNVLFQLFLEDTFPANKTDPQRPGQQTLSKTNTLKKLCLDQTVCATLNTAGYIAALAAYRGLNSAGIVDEVQKDFWPLMQAGWRFWPFVSLLNFTVVPLARRQLVGSAAGLAWGVYISLLASQ